MQYAFYFQYYTLLSIQEIVRLTHLIFSNHISVLKRKVCVKNYLLVLKIFPGRTENAETGNQTSKIDYHNIERLLKTC